MLKRIVAILLCVAMVVPVVPGRVFAGELEETVPEATVQETVAAETEQTGETMLTEAVSSEPEAPETEETSGTTVPTEPTEEVLVTEETVPATEEIIINETVTEEAECKLLDTTAYAGKVISILGDSISTFAGYIPVADGFNLEHLARYPQDNLLTDVNETWWMQVISRLGAKLGINDSWRGATVSGAAPVTSGTTGENASMANLTRIRNLGSNGTPDVILFYGGTNDLAHVSKVGTFDAATAPDTVDLTTAKWDNLADGYVYTLLRLKHFYPDAVIVAMLPTYTATYYSDTKLAQANAVLAEICDHYGVAWTDLRDSGVTAEYLPDGIHPGPEGMDYITEAVLTVLAQCDAAEGENAVYTVAHNLSNVKATLGHYKGISQGKPFIETLTAEGDMTVTVTMGGKDITAECYTDGVISIDAVTGALTITAKSVFSLGERLQTLPEGCCGETNLWPLLEHDTEYYTASGWAAHASGKVRSVTVPVTPGDQLWATSFGASGENGGTINGIRLTWFGEDGVLESMSADAVYGEFTANGCITVPEDANAANVVMWTASDSNEFYILNLLHSYENGICTGCGEKSPDLKGKTISILGASISTFAGTSNGAAADTTNSTIRDNVKYYPNTTIPEVTRNDTWWMQVASDLGLRLLVNNAWSGSAILLERSGTVGAYVDRCVQLHDDTGDNAGEEPDIICIQMGFNDFSYGKDTLGTADIDYDTLITADGYGTPTTTMEATAIMLDKIAKRYPNAEVYMFNHFKRIGQSASDTALMEQLNADITQVCGRFGVTVVDLYTTLTDAAHIGDGRLHPNRLGMDVITEAVKTAILANTAYTAESHKVTFALEGVTADYGTDKQMVAGDAFTVNLAAPAGNALDVTVTMGGEDITAATYADGTVTIDAVTANVTITAKSVHTPATYRWEFDGTDLACVYGENALTKTAGSTTDGVFATTRYTLGRPVVLSHTEPWTVEWKCEGTWKNTSGSGGRMFTTTPVNADCNARYIFKSSTNGIVAMGEKTTTGSHNYGIALADHGIDWTMLHTYRLENRIADDSSNMIYLFVDGVEIGPMNHYYVGTTDKKTTSDWLSGKDFTFGYIGTDTHGLNNCSIEYIQIREAGAPEIDFSGKTISILGDSISTFAGVSNNTQHNSTIGSNSVYYSAGSMGIYRPDTWWQQTADVLGLKLLVNNSWSGSCVLPTRAGTVGAYVSRCQQLHNDTTGETPDIIAVFMGTNDFSYYQSTLGTAQIDYDSLITDNGDGTFAYAEPATTCEAYAIMLHKLLQRYPDAQIYCMTLTARRDPDKEDSYADVGQPTVFNAELKKIIAHFGCTAVDLEKCGIDKEAAVFDTYMGDGRVHPNAEGMDRITEALISAMLGETVKVYAVSGKLSNATLSNASHAVLAGDSYEASVAPENGCTDITVTVTMGGQDITESCYAEGKICIPAVTGDVVIAAEAIREPRNFRWEFDDSDLVPVSANGNTTNELTKLEGTTTNDVFSSTRYQLETALVLAHHRPWIIEWKGEGTGGFMLATGTSTSAGPYFFRRAGSYLHAFGELKGSSHYNYGLEEGRYGIDGTKEHTYRLENRIAEDGTNMVYLLVDAMEVGPMTACYIGGTSQNAKSDWISGRDFRFAYIGTTSHPMTDYAMEYLQVWEAGHTHSYEAAVTAPTCTEAGYTTYTCACGDGYVADYVDATGHTYENGSCVICGAENPNPYAGKTIACIGDSITYGVGVTRDETDYVTVLAQSLDMDYIRLGASGTTLCTDGHATCNIGKLTEANLAGANVVTVLMGINDFVQARNGYYTLGTFDSEDTSTIYGAAHMWCQRIEELRRKDSLKDTEFYFMTPVITSWNNSVSSVRNWDQSKTNVHGYTLRDLCNAIVEVCASYEIPVIDLNLVSGLYYNSAEDNSVVKFGGDGAHPGAVGHQMMADAIENALLQNNLRNDHDHSYGSWITTAYPDCNGGEQQRVCTICTATEGKKLDGKGHTPGAAATCTINQICTVCKVELAPALGHTAVIDAAVAPTCIENGLTEGRHCAVCDEILVRQEEVPALGHTEAIDNAIAPDCVMPGLTEGKHCSACNMILVKQQAVKPLGHSMSDWTAALAPTCTADGLQIGNCIRCDYTEEEILRALGHNYARTVVPPTCTVNGYTVHVCQVCGYEKHDSFVKALGHREAVDPAVGPACTETGLTEGSHCFVCDEILVEQKTISALGHSYDNGKITMEPACEAEGVKLFTCATCGDTHTEAVEATGHTEGEAVVEKENAPTCTTAGSYDTVVSCSVCEAELSRKTITVDAPGHTEVIDAAVSPDCTATGLTEGKHCSVCNAILAAQQTVPAKGHISGAAATCTTNQICTVCKIELTPAKGHTEVIDKAVAPTCAESGLTEGKHCSVCGEVLLKQETIQALGHSMSDWTAALAPTCTAEGLQTRNCAYCGHTEKQILAALDHDFESTVVAPTCTVSGYTAHVCQVCGYEKHDSFVKALGHREVADAAVSPACTETGLTEGKHCSACEIILVAQEVIPALGHTEGAEATCTTAQVCTACGTELKAALGHDMIRDNETPAACTTPGCQAGAHCSRCDYTEGGGEIPALGHTEVIDAAVAPTCTETGLTEGKHCSACEIVLVKQEEVPTLGHTEVVDAAVAPGCTEIGLTEGRHCSVCEAVLVMQEEIPVLGHDYIYGICQRCGDTVKAAYEIFAGKSLTLKEIDPETNKAYTSGQLTWAMSPAFEPFAAITRTGKVTAKKVVEKTRIQVVGTLTETQETIIRIIDVYPAVTQLEVKKGEEIINGKTILMDYTEESITLKADAYPLDTLENVTWTVSDAKKALYADYEISGDTLTITNPKSKAGTVTVKADIDAGTKKTVTVKVQFGSFANTVAIEAPEKTTLRGGESMILKAAITDPECVTMAGITWSVSDKTAASITAAGKLTTRNVVQPTTVTVTAASRDGQAKASINLKIIPKNEGQLVLMENGRFVTNTTKALNVGDTYGITAAVIIDGEPVPTEVAWTTAKTAVAAVENGIITAAGTGTARITAEYEGRKASVTVKVSTLVSDMEITTRDGKNLVDENGEKLVLVSSGQNVTLVANILTQGAAKAVDWAITEGAGFAKILNGRVTANKDLTSVQYVTAKATAKDGSGISAMIRMKIVPLATGVQIFESGSRVRSNTVYVHDRMVSETIKLNAKVYPAKANQSVTLTSSNKKIADFVDGELVCFKTGTVTITAAAQDGSNVKASFKLTIVKKIQSLTLKEGSHLTVIGGRTLNLAPMVQISPGDATNRKLTWSAAPNDYGVKINASGVLSTRMVTEPVTIPVRVTTQDGSDKMLSFSVTVYPATAKIGLYKDGSDVTGKVLLLKENESIGLSAISQPGSAAGVYTWTSSDENYVCVDENGTITALQAGKTITITCKAEDGSGKKAIVKIQVT